MIELEDRCLQIVHFAYPVLLDSPKAFKRLIGLFVLRYISRSFCKEFNQVIHIIDIYRFVDGETHPPLRVIIEIYTKVFCLLTQVTYPVLSGFAGCDLQGVEELRILLGVAISLEHFVQVHGFGMNTLRYLTNSFRTVKNAIHTCHHGRQGLCGTDIRSRFFAFDMLLACLQSQAIRRTLVFILAKTDDSTRHIAFILIARSHITGSRSTKAHRQTKTLSSTAHNICIKRFEQRQSHEIRHNRHFQSGGMAILDKGIVFLDRAIAIGPLHECSKELCRRRKIGITTGNDLDILSFRACAQNR